MEIVDERPKSRSVLAQDTVVGEPYEMGALLLMRCDAPAEMGTVRFVSIRSGEMYTLNAETVVFLPPPTKVVIG